MQKIALVIILIFMLSACSVSRRTAPVSDNTSGKAITGTASIENVLLNNITNKNFNIQRADIRIIQDDVSVRLNASLKYRRPDSMLITVRSKTGLEAGRALITKDTVLINDRVNKTLLIGKPAILGSKYGIEPDLIYAALGDIIIDDNDIKRILKCEKGIFRDSFEINHKRVEYTIDCREFKALKSQFEGDITSGNITIQFENIKTIGTIKYPEKIIINDDLKSMNIYIDIKKLEIPSEGTLIFIPGANYKVVKIR